MSDPMTYSASDHCLLAEKKYQIPNKLISSKDLIEKIIILLLTTPVRLKLNIKVG